jgi:hypothetical protein
MSFEVGNLFLEEIEPVGSHESEQSTLLRNSVCHDDIVGGDAVCGDEEEALRVDFVDLANFAAGNLFQAMLLDWRKWLDDGS